MTQIKPFGQQNALPGLALIVFALSLGLGCIQQQEGTANAEGVTFTGGGQTTTGGGTTGGGTSGGGTSGGGTSGGGTSGGGATASLQEGVFNTGLNFLEAPYLVGECLGNLCTESAGGGNSASGQLLVTLSGAQGDVIFDLQTQTRVLDSAPGDAASDGAFGWVPISQPSPGPNTPGALLRFDESASFGGTLTNYRPSEGAFGGFSQLLIGSFLDAVTAGNTLVSDEILACSDRGPLSIIYRDTEQNYAVDTVPDGSARRFDAGRACVSMVTATAGGPVLSVSRTQGGFSDSRLFFIDRGVQTTEVGVVGVDARRIRHLGGIAVTTLFGDDALRVITWDGQNAPTIVGDPVPVGDGPVGLGLRDAGGSSVQVVTTGFNDNTIAVTNIAPDGSVTANTVFGAPSGCFNPAHAIFIENADDAADPFVMATCFSNGNYVISKVSSLTPVPPPG